MLVTKGAGMRTAMGAIVDRESFSMSAKKWSLPSVAGEKP